MRCPKLRDPVTPLPRPAGSMCLAGERPGLEVGVAEVGAGGVCVSRWCVLRTRDAGCRVLSTSSGFLLTGNEKLLFDRSVMGLFGIFCLIIWSHKSLPRESCHYPSLGVLWLQLCSSSSCHLIFSFVLLCYLQFVLHLPTVWLLDETRHTSLCQFKLIP